MDSSILVAGVDESADDTTLGGYIHAGILWRAGKLFNIGFDLRGMYADVEIGTTDTSAAYYQGGLLMGWGW